MANKEFNNMLDDYVGSIRKKNSINFSEKIKKLFKSKPKKKIQLDQDTTEEYVDISGEGLENTIIKEKKGFLNSFFGKFIGLFSVKSKKTSEQEFEAVFEESEEETSIDYAEPMISDEEVSVKEMKENFISRLFKSIFHPKKKNIEEPEIKTYSSEMEEDVVKVLNIVNELFKKLPQNVKYQFRSSKDFEIYSDVLKKYHIIKKD